MSIQNILNSLVTSGCKYDAYEPLLLERALPFLKEFDADVYIVCAGYDALASDELAQVSLLPENYESISRHIKRELGSKILFGLEGGYNLRDLPIAIERSLLPFLSKDRA